jgi:hypothetical protein
MHTNWTDELTAIGTVATAGVALVGLGVTAFLAKRQAQADRRQLLEEREAAAEAMAQQRADEATRQGNEDLRRRAEERRRLLLRCGELYATWTSHNYSAQGGEAEQQLKLHLLALPGRDAVLLRRLVGMRLTAEGERKLGEIGQAHGSSIPARPDPAWVWEEIESDLGQFL